LLALALAVSMARAGAELLLQDGRTLSGSAVRRQGMNYHLTQADGQVLTIPVELVRELRLVEEGPPAPRPAPTAMRAEGPEVLAGPPDPVEPPMVEDQLAVLGPKAEFRPGIFDPIWVPSSDWTLDPAQNDFNPARWFTAPIDPQWTPLSAFDGRVDVFARSHSKWAASLVDSAWWPTETTWLTPRPPAVKQPEEPPSAAAEVEQEAITGLEDSGAGSRLYVDAASVGVGSGGRAPDVDSTRTPALAQFTPAGRPAAAAGRVDPEVCAREIFRPLTSRGERGREAELTFEPVVDASLTDLPLDLFRGRLELDGQSYSALFATEGETCRLIGGDLDPLLGVMLGDAGKVEHALRSYERALGDRTAPALETAAEKIGYAFSLSLLADPGTSRGASQAPTLIATREDLERFGAAPVEHCSAGAKKRTRELERALADFAPPTVLAAERGDVVTLRTWSTEGGTVTRHTVRLSGTGTTSIERRVVASHVGAHRDEKARK